MSTEKKVLVNEVFVPGAETSCQYIDVKLPIPKGAELVQSNVPIELIGNDTAIHGYLNSIIPGHQITLSQETLRSMV